MADKSIDAVLTDIIAVMHATGTSVVIRGDDGGLQPDGEYASISILMAETAGLPATTYQDPGASSTELNMLVHTAEKLKVSTQFYRAEAFQRAREFAVRLRSPVITELLQKIGLTIVIASDLRDTSYEVAERRVRRCSFEMVVETSAVYWTRINKVASVTVEVNNKELVEIPPN